MALKRYAYQSKSRPDRFGILEAESHGDARRHLGDGYRIRKIMIDHDTEMSAVFDESLRRAIVDRALGTQ